MTFLGLLEKTLLKDSRFVAEDNRVLKVKVYDAVMEMDESLLFLLLSEPILKEHFFKEVKGTLIFDKIKFTWVLNSREFLPDSYTMYRNKIGLTDNNNDIISQHDEVTLAWPYKDCILEGGQTKEDEKRDEVFYNETLAPDQVTRLLYPKVFSGAKRYRCTEEFNLSNQSTVDDETNIACKPVTEFKDEDNFFIKGNNLLALSSLLPRFEGRIQLIYIDPPFNTKNDSFNYNDKFTRSTWLSFMKSRLQLAKRLLHQTGNIFIHIDDNQASYLKVLCDEIFGENNFVEQIIWAYGSPSGGRATTPKPVNIHDYLLHYAKRYEMRKQNRVYTPYSEKYIDNWFKFEDEDGRRYRRRQRGKTENGEAVWIKQYLDESKGMPLSTVWSDIQQVYADPRAYKEGNIADVEVIKEFSGGQKPEALIQRIIEMATDENDLVLDFHMGTGTTAATAHKMNRRYIGVEQMQDQIDLLIPRLIKVIKGEQAGISKSVNWRGGGSFVYCELAERGETLVLELQSATDSGTILSVLDRATEQGLLRPSILPKDLKKTREEFLKFSLDEQKQLVMELLDKNKLYINLCDIDDENMAVSNGDKEFTRSFYRLNNETER